MKIIEVNKNSSVRVVFEIFARFDGFPDYLSFTADVPIGYQPGRENYRNQP